MTQENKHYQALEFTTIRQALAEHALCAVAKHQALHLEPYLDERVCNNRIGETTKAKQILETVGNPPLSPLDDLAEILALAKAGSMLSPALFSKLERFLASSNQMVSFLRRAGTISEEIGAYGQYIHPMKELREEINEIIRNEQVDDNASTELRNIRRHLENYKSSIQSQLERLLAKNPDWYSEHFIINRSGRFVLPVKRQHRAKVHGSAVDTSGSGATIFIEPQSIQKIQADIAELEVWQENEIIRILYTLTNRVIDEIISLETNKHYFEILDFIFAKAKLSAAMKASEATVSSKKEIKIIGGRHPLLNPEICVPLNLTLSGATYGIVITGPNTGGKTVSLKTVGLLSLMVQSGLHVPVDKGSRFSMRNLVLCDIGDGQSIVDNLSTFSAHITKVIDILRRADSESLVLLDELGSGTDPGEGMGLAVAVISELVDRKCLFVTTTHYPEVKEFASKTQHIVNARMAFDRESLTPLYRLEVGEAGESCALYIAQQLGFPTNLLEAAHRTTYGVFEAYHSTVPVPEKIKSPSIIPEQIVLKHENLTNPFQRGDSVMISPENKIGIVYEVNDKKGMVGVQIGKDKVYLNQKRLELHVSAEELYPADYDFSIVFDSVSNRKARKKMGKKHQKDLEILL